MCPVQLRVLWVHNTLRLSMATSYNSSPLPRPTHCTAHGDHNSHPSLDQGVASALLITPIFHSDYVDFEACELILNTSMSKLELFHAQVPVRTMWSDLHI